MKPHRIFIAINLPEGVKGELLAYKQKRPELPARWAGKENLHLTLVFLGNTSDQELAEACRLAREVGERHKPFSVSINRIVYGPPSTLRQPADRSGQARMIWALVEKSPGLLALQKDIAETLGQRDVRSFAPHLTLARLKMVQLRSMEPEEIPEVDEEISFSFPAESIEVMESALKRSGAEYAVCQSVPLDTHEQFDDLLDDLEIYSDPSLLEEIKEAEAQIARANIQRGKR